MPLMAVPGSERFSSRPIDPDTLAAELPASLPVHTVTQEQIDALDPLTYEVVRHRLLRDHLRTHDEVTTARSGTWRTRLTPAEIALCESVAGGLLSAHGYELSGAGKPERGDHAHYLRVSAHRRLAARKPAISVT